MPSWLQKFRDFRRDVMTESRIAETLQRLAADGELTPATVDRLTRTLHDTKHESQYIVGHLSAHLAIGVIFLFDVVPLPLGTIARGAWVAGNRIYTAVRREPHRAKVHSFPVLLVSLIPFVGYFAYLIPLRATNADAAYIYANHIAYLRSDCSLEQSLQRKPRWLQGMIRGVLASVMVKPREEMPLIEAEKT